MSDIQKKFYVLRAISGKENKVREYLEAELKNTDLGEYVSQVLIPTEKTFTVRNGKKAMKETAVAGTPRVSGYPVVCWRECEDYFWTVQRFHGYNRRGQRREKET